MGYPPPTRRLADKKRYHYSNNPNRRHPSGVYSKNSFPKSSNNGFVSSPTADTSTNASIISGTAPAPLPTAISGTTFGIEAPRPSRYDPGSVSRPLSSSYSSTRKIGSRYNPDVERPSSATSSTPESMNTNTITHNNTDIGKSRYSRKTMSRYNPQSTSSSNVTHFPSAISNVAPFYVANGNSRRPRSMDDYSPDVTKNVESSNASSVNGNSPHSYYSRSNKWRSIGTPSRPPFDNHIGNMTTTSNINPIHQREPFWKANSTNFLKSPHSQSSPSLYANKFHDANKWNKPESPVKVETLSKDQTKVTPYHDDKYLPKRSDSKPNVPLESDSIKVDEENVLEKKDVHKSGREIVKEHPIPVKRKEHDELEVRARKVNKIKRDGKQNQIWTTAISVADTVEVAKEEQKEQANLIEREESPEIRDYERIYDPKALKTDVTRLTVDYGNKSYEEPLEKAEGCIFPLPKAETRLWELKNQKRNEIISKQKYLLKKAIKNFSEYPFYVQNKLIHQQATGLILTKIISKIKKEEYLKKIKLKHDYFDLQKRYEKECEILTKLSENLRKEEIENKRKEHELMEQKRREEGIETEKEKSLRHPSSSSSSRRRNRADFVDDAEMENVLLQIDPNYKHYQAAATIPPLILDPVHKYSYKFCDVNNLVTDKKLWASRILKDAFDSFTDHEHSLFLEGYLIHPKKFGKISHYMGGLRTPEECVLHYYRTKKTVNYKQLLIDKNKKRKMSAAAKRRKRKERSNDEETEVNEGKEESMSTVDKEENSENNAEETVQPVLVQVSELKDNPLDTSEKVENLVQKEGEEVTGGLECAERVNDLKRVHDDIEEKDSKSNVMKGNDNILITAPKGSPQDGYYPEDTRELDFSLENALQRKKHKSVPEHKTSYWSVRESQLFPELLKEFGSQWSLISEKLGTKSTTMVRNYYQRNAARNGWKVLVDETDSKRDGTSSESVQQSQILIQPERPNINAYSSIPPQQRPALGYFVGQPTHGPNTSISSIDGSIRPFGPDFHRDSFSKVSAPLTTLPPPRLPSIQFPRSEISEPTMTDLRNRPLDHIDTLADAASSVTNNQNFSNERHAIEINRKMATISNLLNNSDRDMKTSLQSVSRHEGQVEESPNLNNIVVQEIKPNITTPRSSSISALLNPVNGNGQSNPDGRPLPPFNHTISQGAPTFPLPAPHTTPVSRAPPKFNFSNDPLAALAAVASAPDAMNGFLSKKENNN
ncbi:Snt1p [Saccharomyces paradoxus]|uniref:Snt1p n=1 Tax=Saccharomyces paradoxus TaxID=27291 RepID=A0A8B8UMF8_SACPA|nr:Snt1 [Saccharomyces paradoxus]QHS71943.1 Snt1 [Saccharomyces paradoxus]